MRRIYRWGVLILQAVAVALAGRAARFAPAAPEVLAFKGVSMAPLPPLAELLGATVTGGEGGGTIVTLGGRSFTCTLAKKDARQGDGQAVTLPMEPLLMGGVLYVPVRPLVTALGGTLALAGKPPTLHISVPGAPALVLPFDFVEWVPNLHQDNPDNDTELYVMNLDGTALKRLTYDSVDEEDYCLSPDGTTLLFSSFDEKTMLQRRVDSQEVMVVLPADKTAVAWIDEISYSPDGAWILFEQEAETDRIVLMRKDGTGKRVLAEGIEPCFSPDGKLIAYTAKGAIHLMDTDGGNQREVIFWGLAPYFSPDGAMLCCYQGIVTSDYDETYVFNPWIAVRRMHDGKLFGSKPYETLEKQPWPEPELFAEFSPDSKQLVYTKLLTQNGVYGNPRSFLSGEIWLMNADRGSPRQLTQGKFDACPVFTPDGSRIIFTRDADLYSMKPDGSDVRQLTRDIVIPVLGNQPVVFTPDGQQILFLAEPGTVKPEDSPIIEEEE